jgi:drug/metabolite transporter (DMT)-like permease
MAASTLLLVLASAFAHASWNAILKRCRDPEDAIVVMMPIGAFLSVVLAVVLRAPLPGREALLWSLLSGACEAAYSVTLARALARAPFGSVYTIVRGGALVLVWPVSVALLRERLTTFGIAGTICVVLGLASTGAADRTPAIEQRETIRSGLTVAALCAVFVAGYHLADKMALARGSTPAAVNAISFVIAGAVVVIARGARRKGAIAALRAQPGRVLLASVLGAFSFALFLTAMKDAGAGVVMTLRNTSILFAQVLAFATGEKPKRLGVIGAVLVTAGAVLLSF